MDTTAVIICDTNVIIECLKGNQQTLAMLAEIQIQHIALSSISVMELYFGAINKQELKYLKQRINVFSILQVSEEISQLSLLLIERYSKSHHLMIPDALIAATALHYNFPLFTYNLKDFIYIDELRILNN